MYIASVFASRNTCQNQGAAVLITSSIPRIQPLTSEALLNTTKSTSQCLSCSLPWSFPSLACYVYRLDSHYFCYIIGIHPVMPKNVSSTFLQAGTPCPSRLIIPHSCLLSQWPSVCRTFCLRLISFARPLFPGGCRTAHRPQTFAEMQQLKSSVDMTALRTNGAFLKLNIPYNQRPTGLLPVQHTSNTV